MNNEEIKAKLLFNPNGDDRIESRQIIGGNTTNLFNLNETKYTWAKSLYRKMLADFWIPEKVNLSQDKIDYNSKLNSTEKKIMKKILSFLTFLDSIQVNNIPRVSEFITAPEVNTILSIQDFQEVIHSASYAYIIESVIPSNEREQVYEEWREDTILFERNKYIANIYQKFWHYKTMANFLEVIIANYILESLYFYNGFIFFYNLASRNLMLGTADEIRFIQGDEQCYIEGTEILTNEGWKNFKEINMDSKVAQYNMETQEIDFVNPIKVINKDYEGTVFDIHNNNYTYQSIITEDHDMVLRHRKYNKNFKIKPKDAKFNFIYDIPVAGKKVTSKRIFGDIDQLFIALQSDGTIDKIRTGERSGCQVLRFGLKRERKIERLTKILDNLASIGVKYTLNYNKNGYAKFYIQYPNSLPDIPDKNFDWVKLDDIDYNYGQLFINELQFWDGHTPPKGSIIYFSNTNEKAIDKIQAIASISGIKINRSIQIDNRKESYKDVHRLYIYQNDSYKQTQGLNKKEIYYDGKVYCVTVPTGAIITRYNGSVTVSGNCHITIFANIINEIKNEFPDLIDNQLIYDMFKIGCQEEIKWSNHILKDSDIIGLNETNTELYTKYLVNDRLLRIGLEPLFPEANTNPYSSLELQSDSNSSTVKSNFFESKNTNYSISTAIKGWDKI